MPDPSPRPVDAPAPLDPDSLPARAEAFARRAHGSIGQVRKYTGDPYIVHPAGVAQMVSQVPGCSEAMLAAAWLHDVLEDVASVTPEDLHLAFGPEVTSLVQQLTDVSRPGDGNRAVRKAKDRAHLAQASPEAQTVKLADLLDNAASILQYDRAFAKLFLRELAELLEVMNQGDPELYRRARTLGRP